MNRLIWCDLTLGFQQIEPKTVARLVKSVETSSILSRVTPGSHLRYDIITLCRSPHDLQFKYCKTNVYHHSLSLHFREKALSRCGVMEKLSYSTEDMISGDGNVVKIKKSRLWIAAVILLVLIILVGVLSGVLSAKREREKVEEKYAGTAKSKRDAGMNSMILFIDRGVTRV